MAALKRALLLLALCLYTSFAAGPFVWAAMLSLRTTSEIHLDHFAFPSPAHWDKFPEAWFGSNYGVYFVNSLQVVVAAVLILTFVGAMAAHCLGRYRFRLNRAIYFILFSTIIFPPQITIISLFQILVNYGLFNSKLGLTLVRDLLHAGVDRALPVIYAPKLVTHLPHLFPGRL